MGRRSLKRVHNSLNLICITLMSFYGLFQNPVLIIAQKSMLLFVAQMAQHTITNVNWKLPIVRISQRQSSGHLREHVNHNQAIELGNFLLFGRRISSQIWHSLMSAIRREYFIHSNKHKVRNRRNIVRNYENNMRQGPQLMSLCIQKYNVGNNAVMKEQRTKN